MRNAAAKRWIETKTEVLHENRVSLLDSLMFLRSGFKTFKLFSIGTGDGQDAPAGGRAAAESDPGTSQGYHARGGGGGYIDTYSDNQREGSEMHMCKIQACKNLL